MQRYGSLDYQRLTKGGLGLGLALFLVGAVGTLVGHAYFEPLPEWFDVLLFDFEVLGLLVALFSPILFGVVLPLTE
ncbi:hypothetical protein [Halomontanus rarus]|uniref:DUF7860 family protein n=1 Tax=Halomontanus rarus TaxID=3034020 RepID=UPI0023E88260|nr:hypothetical protein [Halovivax sp. TS33]